MTVAVTSTYRFQLHKGFTLDQARDQLPYLEQLGVSHAYCSPILTAVPGSVHGYDVLDHTRVNPELGGREAFVRFAEAAHELGLGVVVDVVPNHVAFVVPENANAPLWALLKGGPDAATASWFDVDWAAGSGTIGVPVLGASLSEEIEAGTITVDTSDAEPVVRYFEHVFPLAKGSFEPGAPAPTGQALADLLARQHYRLAYWRDRDTVLNYRRFFEVSELIAVRVEDEAVFDATHALLLELHHAGHIDGFRIDHPDGLADPGAYLARLSAECRKDTPIWVEKILEPGEHLPKNWHCAGTTGYDAMAAISATLADDAATEVVGEAWSQALRSDEAQDIGTATAQAKRFVVTHNLLPELERLTRRAHDVRPDLDRARLRAAIVELLVAAPVYRAYLTPGERMSDTSKQFLDEAVQQALVTREDLRAEVEAVKDIALMRLPEDASDTALRSATDFAIRLQQTWGPVMAKSIEDTLFYRWNALTALNEVGGSPEVLSRAGSANLHEWAEHNAKYWPLTMTTLSTHDTKRSEDVRAALLALSGDGQAWRECSQAASMLADISDVDRGAAALVWQTIAGFSTAYGSDDIGDHDLGIDPERLSDYLTKALREAKVFTAWIDGDEQYEKHVLTMARSVLDAEDAPSGHGEAAVSADPRATLASALRRAILDARQRNAEAITLTGHSQKVIQLFLPGVPDTYQGSERGTLSLVDPDNRRPVDYSELTRLLDVPGSRPRLVQSCLLPEVHDAARPGQGYEAVQTDSEFLVAFQRVQRSGQSALRQVGRLVGRGDDAPARAVAVVAVRAASRALREGALPAARITMPEGVWRHAFTGEMFEFDGSPVALSSLGEHEFGHVHVLVREK